jgi:DNA-binding transcriptional ArsR family regulator
MPELNAVGDLVLTDPRAMRALADPVRLALHDRLRRHGPATAADLAAHVDATEAAVGEHLRELEASGLVTGGDRWEAVGKGFVFEIPEEPEGQEAARELSRVMLLQYVDLPRRWVAEDEPRLALDWARAAGLFNARVTVSPDELRELQEGLERLLEPYLTREPADRPADASEVRILGYFMPEAPLPGL